MLIPPTYFRLLDPPEAKVPTERPRAPGGRMSLALLAALTGAASGGVTAWLVLINLG